MAKKKTKTKTKRSTGTPSSNGVAAGVGAKKKTKTKARAKAADSAKAPKKKAAKKRAAPKKGSVARATPEEEAPPASTEAADAPDAPEAIGAAAAPAPDPAVRRSAAKRRAVLEALRPLGTSARMARAAQAAVQAISSEKTVEVREAQVQADRDLEEARDEALAQQSVAQGPVDPALRRSSRDPFALFRAELERAEDDPRDPHAGWRLANERLRHEVVPGASAADLTDVEERLGIELPRTYHDFCLEWNGARLYTTEHGCFRVLSATEIVEEIKGPLCNRMVRPYLPVVDLGCGDYLTLDTERPGKSSEYPLYWWYGGEPKKKVADGFGQWLKKVIEAGGAPFWWEL